MADLKFEVHVQEKVGAMAMFEADTREAAEDIAKRMKKDGVKVSIFENAPLSEIAPMMSCRPSYSTDRFRFVFVTRLPHAAA